MSMSVSTTGFMVGKTALTSGPVKRKKKRARPLASFRGARRNLMRQRKLILHRRTEGLDTLKLSLTRLLQAQPIRKVNLRKPYILVGRGKRNIVNMHVNMAKARVAQHDRKKAGRFAGVFGFPSKVFRVIDKPKLERVRRLLRGG